MKIKKLIIKTSKDTGYDYLRAKSVKKAVDALIDAQEAQGKAIEWIKDEFLEGSADDTPSECLCYSYKDKKGALHLVQCDKCGKPSQGKELRERIEALKVDARPEIKDWTFSGSKKEALAHNKAIDDVLALLVK